VVLSQRKDGFSICHMPCYVYSKIPLTDPSALQQLTKQLKNTLMYRFPQSFCRVSTLIRLKVACSNNIHYLWLYISVEIRTMLRASIINCCATFPKEITSRPESFWWEWIWLSWTGKYMSWHYYFSIALVRLAF